VAYVSNALYVFERNGGGNKEYYDQILLPMLKNKIDNLHAEGVS